jgi:hypothetical protein
MTEAEDKTGFTAGPWALMGPQPTGATEPGIPKWDRDPDEYEIRAQPAPFMRGFTHTIAIVLGKENATLLVQAPALHDALKKIVMAARTSGGTPGRDEHLCEACDFAEIVLARARGEAP